LKEYRLRKALKQGRVLYGMQLMTPVPAFVEIIGYSGFDFVFIDLEHTTIDLQGLSNLIIASELANVCSIVRVPDNDAVWIRKILEVGAEGIIVPHIKTSEDALKAVQAAKFPPEGTRGHGAMVRSYKYTFPRENIAEYVRESNEGTTVILLIEENDAVENIEDILSVKGVDAILLGPHDLSISMGLTEQWSSNPYVKDRLEKVMAAAKARGVPIMLGIGLLLERPVTPEIVKQYIEKGVRLVDCGGVERAVKATCLNIMENIVKKTQY